MQNPRIPTLPPFLILPHISKSIKHPAHHPGGPHHGRRDGEPQSRDQQRDDHARLVFDKVGVGSLRAVEEVLVLAGGGLGGGGVRVGVVDLRGFAVAADEYAVPGVEEGG